MSIHQNYDKKKRIYIYAGTKHSTHRHVTNTQKRLCDHNQNHTRIARHNASYLIVRESRIEEKQASVLQNDLIGISGAQSLHEQTEAARGPLEL